MSNRTLVEFNHDYCGTLDDRFLGALQRYLKSASEEHASELGRWGVTVIGMRHHSGVFYLDREPDGFPVKIVPHRPAEQSARPREAHVLAPVEPTEEMVEKVARAMEPRAFEIYDRGYTQRNAFDTAAFLNAEQTVRKARRKAKAAIQAMLSVLPVGEPHRA